MKIDFSTIINGRWTNRHRENINISNFYKLWTIYNQNKVYFVNKVVKMDDSLSFLPLLHRLMFAFKSRVCEYVDVSVSVFMRYVCSNVYIL